MLELYLLRGRKVVMLRMDDQFVTTAIRATLDLYDVKAAVCAPSEHNQNGQGENTIKLVDQAARTLLQQTTRDADGPKHTRQRCCP